MRPTDSESPYFLLTVSGSVYDTDGAYALLNPKDAETDSTELTSIVSNDKVGVTPVKGTEYKGFTISDLTMTENKYQKRALMVAPALDGEFSILVQVSAQHYSFNSLPSDDEMLAKAVELLDCVTIY